MSGLRWVVAVLLVLPVAAGDPLFGQTVDVGGRTYVDYFYAFSAPESAAEDLHGFRYRRLYLTADFALSEEFEGRARLEAPEGASQAKVKDLSLTWTYAGAHSATLGVTPPPAFGVAEDGWGYRSLEKTIMDLQGVVRSRDFGLRVDGPLVGDGTVRYAAMVANNTGTGFEETNEHKRVYGQLHATPTDRLTLVAGADYATYGDQREGGTRLSAFGGYERGRVRVGVEGYWYRLTFADRTALTDVGGSLFGIVRVRSGLELVARLDRSAEYRGGPDRFETFLLGGVAYRPHPNVTLIPNLRIRDASDQAVDTSARFTVWVQF
jgi:hypothetical protein